tara:strand:- start:2256 stop:3023 length:768 start_codon:yes stop_codon:yes gene_type:complete
MSNLTKKRARVDYDMSRFRKLIEQKGLKVGWSRSIECPCSPKSESQYGLDLAEVTDINVGSGFALNCTKCKGKGLFHEAEREIDAILTSATGEYLNAIHGGYREATISITMLPEHIPCFGDRIVLKDSVMLFREVVVCDGNTTPLRFDIVDYNTDYASAAENVVYAHATNADGTTATNPLVKGTDFIVANNQISWIIPQDQGTRVTFTYYINPTYTIISYPNSIRDTKVMRKASEQSHQPLLVRAQAKLEFLGGE